MAELRPVAFHGGAVGWAGNALGASARSRRVDRDGVVSAPGLTRRGTVPAVLLDEVAAVERLAAARETRLLLLLPVEEVLVVAEVPLGAPWPTSITWVGRRSRM